MSNIKCPHCGNQFALTDALSDEMNALLQEEKTKMNQKWTDLKSKMEEEFAQKQQDIEKQRAQTEQLIKSKAAEEFQAKIKSLEEERNEKSKQLQDLQKKELDLLRDKNALEEKQKNFELELEKKLLEKRKAIEEDVLKREQELFDMKMKEKEVQMDSLKKTIEELKRKSEQGSMQAQGEAQELMLEDLLKEHFPFDLLSEVGKGVEGADCIQTVCTKTGTACGTIIYESKNAKHWKNEWIEKLKNDKRTKNADIAVLVTQVFPKNIHKFTEIEGIWVCNFQEVVPLVNVLRNGILKVHEVQKNQENKGDKMQLLYDFLTGNEFRGQVEAIVEGFVSMRNHITKERITMEKIWKEREKQIEKVLISTSGMFGSIKGIAGAGIVDIPLLDGE